MRILLLLLIFCSGFAFSQNDLSIQVHGVPDSQGKVSIAIYDNEEGFLKFDKVFKYDSIAAEKGITKILVKDLPIGEYAVAVFYDENSNDKLDTNWLGIPKEKVGFSKSKMKTFGPPNFKECAFKVTSNTNIDVVL
ncbi:DUF2141 domain-containing protein [Croceivirga lutea]|uniref:DUF2141 domain-containing protein n=1 Tax=Croceivirga lutea TaxID=1775167 RepID=UPI00163AB276|nr:DUF2141 domain-containing protein [Croceivirga lutea]